MLAEVGLDAFWKLRYYVQLRKHGKFNWVIVFSVDCFKFNLNLNLWDFLKVEYVVRRTSDYHFPSKICCLFFGSDVSDD